MYLINITIIYKQNTIPTIVATVYLLGNNKVNDVNQNVERYILHIICK